MCRYLKFFLFIIVCFITLQVQHSYALVDEGLLAHFPLDGDATDVTGSGFDGVITGATPSVNRFGNEAMALYFDGDDKVLTRLDMAEEFNAGDPLSFSVWFNTVEGFDRGVVLAGDLPGLGPEFHLAFKQGRLSARIYDGNEAFANETYNDGEWHHAVWGTSGTENFFYVDGVKQANAPTIGVQSRDFITLGVVRNNESYFTGYIDDLRVYDRGLTEEEVLLLYNETSVIEDNKDAFELLAKLIQEILDFQFPKNLENSYLANLKKVEGFLNKGKYTPAENQLFAFLKKLESDYLSNQITGEIYDDFWDQGQRIFEKFPEANTSQTPLITQVISEYPSVAETTLWASEVYAGGKANTPGDCGLTVAQCGCLLTSLVMLGLNYNVGLGVDGSSVNPKNMNDWLLASGKGYDAVGNIMWPWALAYLGEEKNGKYMSHLSIEALGVTNHTDTRDFVESAGPALGFSNAKGHWMVLTGLTNSGYVVNDPFWYNTQTTNDERTTPATIQDYDDVINKSTLLAYSNQLKPVQELIHLSLASPAELLITDEEGRRTGYDHENNAYVNEIPGATYDPQYTILDPADPSDSPHHTKQLILVDPEGELFSLEIIGIDTGDYHLTTAVSDGGGSIFGEDLIEETNEGEVDQLTIVTLAGTDGLPDYLQDILALIPLEDQEKFIQAFKVIASQLEKEHVIPTHNLIENLIRYIENHYSGEAWASDVIDALEEVI